MHQLTVFTYLKNADLTCLSAKDTITKLMRFSSLKSLSRFKMWEFKIEDTPNTIHNAPFKAVIQNSYRIVNQNKEGYYIDTLPPLQSPEITDVFFLKVFPKSPPNTAQLNTKLTALTGSPISTLKKSILWQIGLQNDGETSELADELTRKVVVSSDQKSGLLVNPLYESFELLKQDDFPTQN